MKQIFRSDIKNDPYEGSGYVLALDGGRYVIGNVGHCSCTGTWRYGTDLPSDEYEGFGTGATEVFRGTWQELVAIAFREADPAMPDRKADPEDFDYEDLVATYKFILEQKEPPT